MEKTKIRMKLYKKSLDEPGFFKTNSPNLCPSEGLTPSELLTSLVNELEKQDCLEVNQKIEVKTLRVLTPEKELELKITKKEGE